jgi:transformation/transcription domain-associated protein
LKLLAECPISTVIMYQIHKNMPIINQDLTEIMSLIVQIVTIKPSFSSSSSSTSSFSSSSSTSTAISLNNNESSEQQQQQLKQNVLNQEMKEIYGDFVTFQVRALSFVIYFKQNKDILNTNAAYLVDGVMQLFQNCPHELISVRKDLLTISRHIIADLRQKFLPYMSRFFSDENLLFNSDTTSSSSLLNGGGGPNSASFSSTNSFDSLRSNACSIVADLVHNVRKQLSYKELCQAINYFTKCLHDPQMYINIQHMCCRVLLGLVDCIKSKEQENSNVIFYFLVYFSKKKKNLKKNFNLMTFLDSRCFAQSFGMFCF